MEDFLTKPYGSKQELREDIESKTDPSAPLPTQMGTIMASALLSGCIGVRSGLHLLRQYTTDNETFPNEIHERITRQATGGMKERMIAFELEIMNMMVDLLWEINQCKCDLCAEREADAQVSDKQAKAKYN